MDPKEQDFWSKINTLKGNHCILRIWGAPVGQKLGIILENKVVQKLKLEKNITEGSCLMLLLGPVKKPH